MGGEKWGRTVPTVFVNEAMRAVANELFSRGSPTHTGVACFQWGQADQVVILGTFQYVHTVCFTSHVICSLPPFRLKGTLLVDTMRHYSSCCKSIELSVSGKHIQICTCIRKVLPTPPDVPSGPRSNRSLHILYSSTCASQFNQYHGKPRCVELIYFRFQIQS